MKSPSKILIYCSILLIPFYFFRFSVLGINTNIFEVAVLLALVVELGVIAKSSQRLKQSLQIDRRGHGPRDDDTKKAKMKDWILPAILLLVALVSVFISDDKTRALGIFKGWFLVPIVFSWLISKNFNKKNIKNLAVPIYISLIVISIWAILQKIGIISTLFYQSGDSSFSQYILGGRVFGPFESPNFLAMFLVPFSLISLSLLFESAFWRVENLRASSKNIFRILFAISFVLPLLALYFSGSRAGYVTFIIGILIFLNYRFINRQKTENRKPFFAALLVSLFILVNAGYLFFAAQYFKPSNDSDSIRVEIYKYSETILRQHPISGIGLGQFQSSVAEVSKNSPSFQTWGLSYALHPHNLFLAVWLNLGLAGLIVFVLLLVKLFHGLYFNDSKYKAYFIAAAFAILINGLFDTTYFKNDLSAIFWLIFAASLIIEKNNEEITS